MAAQRPTLTGALSAFDFDVITDAPQLVSRRPDPAPPETSARPPERDGEDDRAAVESAGFRPVAAQ